MFQPRYHRGRVFLPFLSSKQNRKASNKSQSTAASGAADASQKWVITPAGVHYAESKAALLNTFGREDRVYVEPPPITATPDRSSLNVDLPRIKYTRWSEEQPVTSGRSRHGRTLHFPQAKKPLKCS